VNPTTLRAALVPLLVLPIAACTANQAAKSSPPGTVQVSSTDDRCDLSADAVPAGNLVFEVTNDGNQVTEFYLLSKDGERVVGEVENIGPGLTRQLVLKARPGHYLTACKPGMTGEGLRGEFTVSSLGADTTLSGREEELVAAATVQYRDYVRAESDALLAGTRGFVRAYEDGRDERARHLYPRVRTHWERIEPVAESFGDLDPRMDAREADLAEGEPWTGWHRIEKDLWPPTGSRYQPLTNAERSRVADRLLADTVDLHARAQKLHFTEDQIANGAKGLLDEVATGKVTGEEEIWSHTDLFDFQANVEGARVAFTGLRPLLDEKDPALATLIAQRFATVQRLLDRHRGGDGFVSYAALSTSQVKQLSDGVNALSEPLSRLTAAVVAS
jgi:iron uptake system component EfeO